MALSGSLAERDQPKLGPVRDWSAGLTTAIGPIQRPDRNSGATNPTDLADRVPDLGSQRGSAVW